MYIKTSKEASDIWSLYERLCKFHAGFLINHFIVFIIDQPIKESNSIYRKS